MPGSQPGGRGFKSPPVHKQKVNQIEEIARKLRKAIDSYVEGVATLPRAAEIAGLTVWEIIDLLAKKKIQPQYEIEELEEDLKAFEND